MNDRFAVAEPDRFEPWLVYDEVYRPMAGLGSWVRRRGVPGYVLDELRGFEGHRHHSWLYDITAPSLIEPCYGRVALVSGEVLERGFAYSHMGIGPVAESLAELESWALTHDDVELDRVISMHEPLETLGTSTTTGSASCSWSVTSGSRPAAAARQLESVPLTALRRDPVVAGPPRPQLGGAAWCGPGLERRGAGEGLTTRGNATPSRSRGASASARL